MMNEIDRDLSNIGRGLGWKKDAAKVTQKDLDDAISTVDDDELQQKLVSYSKKSKSQKSR